MWKPSAWVQTPALPLTGCANCGGLLRLHTWFLICKMRITRVASAVMRIQWVNLCKAPRTGADLCMVTATKNESHCRHREGTLQPTPQHSVTEDLRDPQATSSLCPTQDHISQGRTCSTEYRYYAATKSSYDYVSFRGSRQVLEC